MEKRKNRKTEKWKNGKTEKRIFRSENIRVSREDLTLDIHFFLLP
jgi:hypothetical protein